MCVRILSFTGLSIHISTHTYTTCPSRCRAVHKERLCGATTHGQSLLQDTPSNWDPKVIWRQWMIKNRRREQKTQQNRLEITSVSSAAAPLVVRSRLCSGHNSWFIYFPRCAPPLLSLSLLLALHLDSQCFGENTALSRKKHCTLPRTGSAL